MESQVRVAGLGPCDDSGVEGSLAGDAELDAASRLEFAGDLGAASACRVRLDFLRLIPQPESNTDENVAA
jgi:hypothetical protein